MRSQGTGPWVDQEIGATQYRHCVLEIVNGVRALQAIKGEVRQ